MEKDKKVWLITGTSCGFGHELVKAALDRGDCVIATSRNPEKVKACFPNSKDRLLTIALNFHDAHHIEKTLKDAITHFGRIDILINNAGHGLLGAIEEASDEEIARVYEINVFGLLRVTRAVLPYMRRQESGSIVNISSIVGLVGLPGWGIYSSTKFAVEGISESLAQEVSPLGIHVMIVEPGPFRTDFLGNSLMIAAHQIPDYEETAGETRKNALEGHGKQEGNPEAAAQAIINAITSQNPPLHLPLGAMAYTLATEKSHQLLNEFKEWQEVALASDYVSS